MLRRTVPRSSIAALALLLVPAMLLGCEGPASSVFQHASGAPSRWSESLADRQAEDAPYQIELSDPVGLDVELFNGDLSVVVDPEATEATITVTRGASHGYKRKDDAVLGLEEIKYEFDLVPGELGRVLQIRATTESSEPHYLRADVELVIPEIENVRVRSGSGNIEILGATGTVDIEVVRGNIRYLTMLPMHRSVRMITGRGDVDLRVRGESSGAILAEALRGQVLHRVTHGRWLVKPGTSYNRLLASFNGGRNPVELRTVEGNVRFASVQDPLAVGAMIVD